MVKNQNRTAALLLCLVMLFSFSACGNNQDTSNTTTKKPTTAQATKEITVEVVAADKSKKSFKIDTDEGFLRKALEQEKLVQGTESEYGLFIKTVNGYTANESNKEWWCITKAGKTVETGVDTTPISDGDKFELTLTVGY
ncbi:MAG: DUF4430 domain-containing protein [Oscillospiraceae bacterium]